MSDGQRGRSWGSIFLLLLVTALLSVLVRCWYLQYYQAQHFQERAARQQLKIIPQTFRRGLIVDRHGRVLALSVKVPSVWADPTLIKDKHKTAFGFPKEQIDSFA